LERTSLDGWCQDAKRFFSLVRGSVLTTLVTTVSTYFILFLGLALLSRATFFPVTFDSDHPDVHIYAHLPTSAFFFWAKFRQLATKKTQCDLYRGFFLKLKFFLAIFLRKKRKNRKKNGQI
jgi:hypothetical protein